MIPVRLLGLLRELELEDNAVLEYGMEPVLTVEMAEVEEEDEGR